MAEIKVNVKLIPTPRGQARIYRLKSPSVNEKAVRGLAQLLGMQADAKSGALKSDADKLTYSQGALELTMYRASGGIRFIDRARWQVDDRQSDLKIEDAAASRLAQTFVKKYQLAPAGETKFLKAARLHVAEATEGGKEASDRTIDVAVALQRQVDKIPVDGPGGQVVVYLDYERKATGIERIWREIAGVQKQGAAYRTPQNALEDMAAHFKAKQCVIEVQEMRFGYFEEGWRSKQQYLQPAYVIIGMLTSPDGLTRKRTIYVAPALTNAVGRITPPLEVKRPEQERPAAKY
ncbi:MAG: hypothetical protein JWM21_2201 [Acidobacteria bacterium]|nr:hypothetical protein [Acidobacteriota bacterium]